MTLNQFIDSHNIPAKWRLLPVNHPVVVKRLAKALNEHGYHGFYYFGKRWNCARVRKGVLEVGFCRKDWTVIVNPEAHFDDGNGNSIVASRTVCGH